MKIFLTGGTGFIGQPLTQSLIARGWDVVALVLASESTQAGALTKMGAQCVTGDIIDYESMRACMKGADIVVHNAGLYELGVTGNARKHMYAVNVIGTDNVLSMAQELGVPRTVYVSSTIFWGETGPDACDETYQRQKPYNSYYEQTKAVAHKIAQDHLQRGLPLIIVCPNAVVGPNDHSSYGYFLRLYLNHLLMPYSWAPDIISSLVHVNDVAKGIALAAEKGQIGETYILAGEPTSRREMVDIWMTKPGGFKVGVYFPDWLVKVLFAPVEPFERLGGLPAAVSRETVSASVSMNYSSEKAKRELGWTHLPAKEMWLGIIDRELELLAGRKKRDLVSRLNPVETIEQAT
jgi:nucleoside-diphosphate-sugar epimerase